MRAQRQRLVTLLTVLARRGPEDLLIRKIEGTENEVVLHGLCLETQFADNLAAAALAEALGARRLAGAATHAAVGGDARRRRAVAI